MLEQCSSNLQFLAHLNLVSSTCSFEEHNELPKQLYLKGIRMKYKFFDKMTINEPKKNLGKFLMVLSMKRLKFHF